MKCEIGKICDPTVNLGKICIPHLIQCSLKEKKILCVQKNKKSLLNFELSIITVMISAIVICSAN